MTMKGLEIKFQKAKDDRFLAIYTPFQEYVVGEILDDCVKNQSVQTFDLSNQELVKKLMELSLDEFRWLITETSYVIFSHWQHSPKLRSKLKYAKNFQHDTVLIILGISKNEMFNLTQELKKPSPEPYILPSFQDVVSSNGIFSSTENLSHNLVFGMSGTTTFNSIPFSTSIKQQKNRINKSDSLQLLLLFLASKATQTFGFAEIGAHCNIDNETAQRYVFKLVDWGIIHLIPSFSTRKKHEYIKGYRAIFTDNLLLNGYLKNFLPLKERMDESILWKNWLLSERIKMDVNDQKSCRYYFWQSHTRQSVDFIRLDEYHVPTAFTLTFDGKKKGSPSALFKKYYPDISMEVIHKTNFISFLIP